MLDGSYYACLDGAGTLMGYFCFGQSARIPLSQEQQALMVRPSTGNNSSL